MSSLPTIAVSLFLEVAPRMGWKVTEQARGLVVERGSLKYRLIPYEGCVRGSQLRGACIELETEPGSFMDALTAK